MEQFSSKSIGDKLYPTRSKYNVRQKRHLGYGTGLQVCTISFWKRRYMYFISRPSRCYMYF